MNLENGLYRIIDKSVIPRIVVTTGLLNFLAKQ